MGRICARRAGSVTRMTLTFCIKLDVEAACPARMSVSSTSGLMGVAVNLRTERWAKAVSKTGLLFCMGFPCVGDVFE